MRYLVITPNQVVSPASPTYLHNLALSPDEIAYRTPPPYVAVGSAASGFTLLQVDVDERSYRVHRRLSGAALRALLAATPHAPPLLLQQTVSPRLPYLPRERATLPLRAAPAETFVKAALLEIGARSQLPPSAFRPLAGGGRGGADAAPRPLYVSTAAQIGLLGAAGIPDLPSYLLPAAAPAASIALLRRWLLVPPRPSVADHAQAACAELAQLSVALPSCRPLPAGKLTSVLSAQQANVPFFSELRANLAALHAALETPALHQLNTALLALVKEESGVPVAALRSAALRRSSLTAIDAIDAVVVSGNAAAEINGGGGGAGAGAGLERPSRDAGMPQLVPDVFFARNEKWRNLVRPELAVAQHAELAAAAAELCAAVRSDLPSEAGWKVTHDIFNNALYFRREGGKANPREGGKAVSSKAVSSKAAATMTAAKAAAAGAAEAGGVEEAAEAEEEEEAGGGAAAVLHVAKDRNKRQLPNRLISPRVEAGSARYRAACEALEEGVRTELRALCAVMLAQLPTLLAASHWAIISRTLTLHVGVALEKRWALPALRAPTDDDRGVSLSGVWPYWLGRDEAVPNTLEWRGVWVLTAPNMAGKSSLMRATTVAALLGNAGLF